MRLLRFPGIATVIKYVAAQIRGSVLRASVFAVGVLLATASFPLLVAGADTSQAEISGTLSSHFRTPYDILVRPSGSDLAQETRGGLVQPNFEGELFGGISISQWRQIQTVPGVTVAAPLENIGYVLAPQTAYIDVSRFLPTDRSELLRLHLSWLTNNATASYPGQTPYIYVTPSSGGCGLPAPRKVVPPDPISAFDVEGPGQGSLTCYEVIQEKAGPCFAWSGLTSDSISGPQGACRALIAVDVSVPRLFAAVDPDQENKLLPLEASIVDGHALVESDKSGTFTTPGGTVQGPRVPVIVSSRSYVDESLGIRLDAVTASQQEVDQAISYPFEPPGEPPIPPVGDLEKWDAQHFALVSALPATTVGQLNLAPAQLFESGTSTIGQQLHGGFPQVWSYWSVSSVSYTSADGVLIPNAFPPDRSIGTATIGPGTAAPLSPSSQDVWFRHLHEQYGMQLKSAPASIAFAVQGAFDPTRLPNSDPLAAVPLAYSVPEARPGDSITSKVLGGKNYLPTRNVGGYIAQPPYLLTTLTAAQPLVDGTYFSGVHPTAPLSLIRVRVAGVSGDDRESIQRIRSVAALIHERTGLTVDVMDGSSPIPTLVRLPASQFGTPSLLLSQDWVKKGVATSILAAADRKSLLLVDLMLIVTVVFLGLAGMNTVGARRREFGLLQCLGWRRREIFASILVETLALGTLGALVGALLAYSIARAGHLSLPVSSVGLAVAIAVSISALSGLLPAIVAASAEPLDLLRSAVLIGHTSRRLRTVEGMAWLNLRRRIVPNILALATLSSAVAALTVLLAVSLAFKGAVAGTLLGNFVSVETRGSDYVAVSIMLAFAAGALTEVLVLSIRERAVEFTTLRAAGWSPAELVRLVVTEGLELGLAGCLLGAAAGLSVGVVLGGPFDAVLETSLLACGAGTVACVLALLIPSRLVSLMPLTELSAEA